MTPATFISKDRRISATIGGVLLAAGTIIGGTGATITLKVQAEARDRQHDQKDVLHDQTDQDHEARLRALEATVAPSLARIEAKLEGIESRIK